MAVLLRELAVSGVTAASVVEVPFRGYPFRHRKAMPERGEWSTPERDDSCEKCHPRAVVAPLCWWPEPTTPSPDGWFSRSVAHKRHAVGATAPPKAARDGGFSSAARGHFGPNR